MIILLVLLLVLLVSLARGGQLAALLQVQPRHLWILFAPLAFQLVAFSSFGDQNSPIGVPWAVVLYMASLACAALALWLNRQLPGVTWIAAGLTLNWLVIALNGGFMPVWTPARELAGMPPLTGRDMNVIPVDASTRLPFLGDIIPLPAWVPLANVFSIGDVFITLGGVLLIWKLTRPAANQQTSRGSNSSI